MKFSIIVVALNPGEKLEKTLNSIFSQTCTDYEIILKDGGSRDGSMEAWRASERVEFFCEAGKGIYDAMNQAVSHASGEYLLFLNCGDLFADNRVLEKTADFLKQQECDVAVPGKVEKIGILYGDTIGEKNGVIIAAPPKMTGFTCYRNIPCHQACFYRQDLCKRKPYEQKYRIRADYDHFLWCFFEEKVTIRYMGFPVHPMRAEVIRKVRKTESGTERNTERYCPVYSESSIILVSFPDGADTGSGQTVPGRK